MTDWWIYFNYRKALLKNKNCLGRNISRFLCSGGYISGQDAGKVAKLLRRWGCWIHQCRSCTHGACLLFQVLFNRIYANRVFMTITYITYQRLDFKELTGLESLDCLIEINKPYWQCRVNYYICLMMNRKIIANNFKVDTLLLHMLIIQIKFC